MAYVGDVTIGSTNYLAGSRLYGTCTTGASTAAKVAVIDGFDTLKNGVTVHIKFTNSNTAATPTLAIKPSSSGTATTAKNIYRYGTTKPGTTAIASWQAGQVVSFTYVEVDSSTSYWYLEDTGLVGSTTSVGSASGWSAGTAPSLSYTAKTVKSVKTWSAGSAPTLGTAFSVPNVTSVGSTPTLGTAISADDITGWTPNTPTGVTLPTLTYDSATTTLIFNAGSVALGTAAQLDYTAKSIPNVTNVGSTPTLGTAFSIPNVTSAGSAASLTTEDIACDDITNWSAGTTPSLTVSTTTVVTG